MTTKRTIDKFGGSPPASTESEHSRDSIHDRNRDVYEEGSLAHSYVADGHYIDAGERRALEHVAAELRNQPILELGVGAGRITALLRLITDEYAGLDYAPAQVAQCHEAFPGADVSEGDARDLSRFADSRFRGVVFSWNGLDALDRCGRLTALQEFRRVLRDDGVLVFCTLNKDGPLYRRPPWRREVPNRLQHPVRQIIAAAVSAGLDWNRTARSWLSWWPERHFVEEHDTWAIAPRGSGHGLVNHWTTLEGLRTDLSAAALWPEALFESDGTPIPPDANGASGRWIHVIARCRSTD